MALNLRHQTAQEFAERFWRRVRDLQQGDTREERIRFARLIWWLVERIDAGDITDNGARVTFNTAFGRSLTSNQWDTLKTNRLVPIHDRYAALLAEEGL